VKLGEQDSNLHGKALISFGKHNCILFRIFLLIQAQTFVFISTVYLCYLPTAICFTLIAYSSATTQYLITLSQEILTQYHGLHLHNPSYTVSCTPCYDLLLRKGHRLFGVLLCVTHSNRFAFNNLNVITCSWYFSHHFCHDHTFICKRPITQKLNLIIVQIVSIFNK
jgi:hypothetical protein